MKVLKGWLRAFFVTTLGTVIGGLVYSSVAPIFQEDLPGVRLLLALMCGGMGYSSVEGIFSFLEEEGTE